MMNQHGSQTSPTKDDAALISIPILGAVENSAHESLMTIQENQKLRYQYLSIWTSYFYKFNLNFI